MERDYGGQEILMKKRTQNENEENLLLESDKPTTSSFVQRTMLILEVLSGKEKGLVDIANETGLSKSTIYRILVSLVNLDYAYKVAETEKYGLTLKFNKLADGIDVLNIPGKMLSDVVRKVDNVLYDMVFGEDGEKDKDKLKKRGIAGAVFDGIKSSS